MSRHRHEPPPRVRPRYPRLGAALVSASVTMIALLGGLGLLPVHGTGYVHHVRLSDQHTQLGSSSAHATTPSRPTSGAPPSATPGSTSGSTPRSATGSATAAGTAEAKALPQGSGEGRRVVFSMAEQRVWLVDKSDHVLSSYLVSGSLTDNLRPGRYAVYSRSRWAVGVDDSGVMQYFVRFAHGQNAAIGFHSIPTHLGKPLQSKAELGTPQSHGCIRQAMPDAQRMWRFAQTGTRVVVTA